MLSLPEWAKPFLHNQNCPYCDSKTEAKGVIGFGVRQKDFTKDIPEAGDVLLTFDYHCANCDQRSTWTASPADEANFGPVDIVKQLLKAAKGIKLSKESISKISNEEVDNLLQIMNEAESFEEFLRYLGIDESIINE